MPMPFAAYVVRQWYLATGWDDYNTYGSLNRPSFAILDFTVDPGCRINVGSSPARSFANDAALVALGKESFLSGSLAYFHARPDLDLGSSRSDAALRFATERFVVPRLPARPRPLDEVWLAGERVDETEQLLYGRLSIPSGRLDALWAARLSQSVLTTLGFVSVPAQPVARASPTATLGATVADFQATAASLPPRQNLHATLAHDTGRWSTQYSYTLEDGLFGVHLLHHFAFRQPAPASINSDADPPTPPDDVFTGAGLRGRFSAGAELYASAQARSAGLSLGARFCTVPDARHPQPPTVITTTVVPMMGHVRTAYAARVGRDLALCSRFDFNFYSYASEVAVGAEWWQRAPDASTRRQPPRSEARDRSGMASGFWQALAAPEGDVVGLLKVRASTSADIRIAWERKIRNCLVGCGVATDWSGQKQSAHKVGLSLSYWS